MTLLVQTAFERVGQGMVFWLQIASAVIGIIAAALWFRSAAGKAPPMSYGGIERLQGFLNSASHLNRWAAGATAVSVLLSAVATLFAATSLG